MAIERDRFDEVTPAPAAAVTATRATEFSSIALQAKLRAATRAGTVRDSWRLSDGREVLLTVSKCHVAERYSGKVWSAPYPSSAGLPFYFPDVGEDSPPTEEQEAERERAREREQERLAALGGHPVTWDAADVHEAAAGTDK